MIIYASRTGNVRFIVDKLDLPACEITPLLKPESPYYIFTYTDGLGDVPKVVLTFLEEHYALCRGVIASGNSNFGHHVFCASADRISSMYNVPIIHKIELRGFQKDYDYIRSYYYENLMEGAHGKVSVTK